MDRGLNRRLARRMRLWREVLGLDLNHVARETGIPKGRLEQVEAGRYDVSLDEMEKMCAATGFSVSQLLEAGGKWEEDMGTRTMEGIMTELLDDGMALVEGLRALAREWCKDGDPVPPEKRKRGRPKKR